jgi:cytochrome b561
MPALHKSLEGIHGPLSHLWIPLLILHLAGVAKHVLARDGALKGMIHPRSEGV